MVRSPKPSADAFTDAMSMLERFRDDICACSDTPCIEQVTKEISKWGETMAKQADPARKPTPEETRRMTEISRQLTECMSRAMSAGPPTP